MDIEQLRTLLEVNRSRHFRLAAEALFVTQSTVSARIKKLEQELGVALFERNTRNIKATPEGHRMLSYAEAILALWRRARQEVALADQSRQPLALGGLFSLWDIFLQRWLAELQRQRSLALVAECHDHEFLIRRLLDGALDLAFVYDPPQLEELLTTEVASVPLLLVSTEPGLNAAAALAESYYFIDWGHAFALQHARQYPDARPPAGRMNQARLALQHILACGGSAYLAEQMIAEPLLAGRLHRVADAPPIVRSAHAVYLRRSERAGLINELLARLTS